MTQEEKELLLMDLSARLPYGTFIREYHDNGKIKHKKLRLDANAYAWFKNGVKVKPYLRPMSSMTEEERKEYDATFAYYGDCPCYTIKTFDFLNKKHFDYRGLIEKGLALEAPKDMYVF